MNSPITVLHFEAAYVIRTWKVFV